MSDQRNSDQKEIISTAFKAIIGALGEDLNRPGLKDTPLRVANSLLDLTQGHTTHPSDVVKDAIFPCEGEGMIVQQGIEFFSLCEHHLLPFYGQVHIAYLPDQKIIGLSKIGRIIDIFAKRLQVQENLTHQIACAIEEILKPKGVAIILQAQHFCMMMRGVKKQGGLTITSEYLGSFKSDATLRSDFMQKISGR